MIAISIVWLFLLFVFEKKKKLTVLGITARVSVLDLSPSPPLPSSLSLSLSLFSLSLIHTHTHTPGVCIDSCVPVHACIMDACSCDMLHAQQKSQLAINSELVINHHTAHLLLPPRIPCGLHITWAVAPWHGIAAVCTDFSNTRSTGQTTRTG